MSATARAKRRAVVAMFAGIVDTSGSVEFCGAAFGGRSQACRALGGCLLGVGRVLAERATILLQMSLEVKRTSLALQANAIAQW